MRKINRNFNGLAVVNVELTSLCNKECWCCGRRVIEKKYPKLVEHYGHMDIKLMRLIARQLPEGIVIQLHNNGEPLLFPYLGHALRTFQKQITHFDTNGKLLLKKAAEIIGYLDSMAVSIIENDPESEQQYLILRDFLELKLDKKPIVVLRFNGDVNLERYRYIIDKHNLIITTRTLHSPMGSFQYRRNPTIPELGICWEALHHLSIDKDGKVSMCVRFDPYGLNIIGDATVENLYDIWNGVERQKRKRLHIKGKRNEIPLCNDCDYWGVPTGKD